MTSGPGPTFVSLMLASGVKSLYKAMYRLFTQESNASEQDAVETSGRAAGHPDDRCPSPPAARGGGGTADGRAREGGPRAVADRAGDLPLPRSRGPPAQRSRPPVCDDP